MNVDVVQLVCWAVYTLQRLSSQTLVGNANDAAGGAEAGVASLQGLLVATLAEVIGAGVDNNSAADDAVGADQLDQGIGDGALGIALGVGLDVAEVADVAGLIGRGAVGLAMGVD